MPTVDKSVSELLARMAVAGGAREVAESMGLLVDEGVLAAVVVWSLDGDDGPLRPLYAAGIDNEVVGWNARPRTPDSPLWSALDAGEGRAIDPLPPELSDSGIDHWFVDVLFDGQQRRVGIALCGWAQPEPPAGMKIVVDVLGPTLRRALNADRAAMRSGLLDHVVELMNDGVIVATPDGEILVYNPALERMTGWSNDDVVTHGWTNLVYPDPAVRAELQRGIVALMKGSPSEGVVRTLARKDGTELSAAIWSRLVPDPSGFPPAMLGVMHDVTSERMARRRAIWEESNAQLGRLAGGIAHEFNNLLAAIMGHADIIALRTTDENVERHAATILKSAERGADLSTQLLAFSGTGSSRTDAVSVGPLVEQAVELIRPRAEGIALGTRLDDIPPVEVDAGQIQQVLINLLVNAVDAVGTDGSIELIAGVAPLPERVRYRSPHAPDAGTPMARLGVRDSGPGFTPDALAHLFVPFYSGKPRGHGVGLPAVRGIVAAHGGAIDVQNDGGALVEVYLPISTRPELDLPTLVADEEGKGERIWLVDDESAVLEFTRISLESRGYDVRSFDSAPAATAAVTLLDDNSAPAVVVLDVVMPDGGGLAVFEALKRAGRSPRVIWTSGHTPDDVALPEDDPAFLQKPFTGADLASLVHRLLP